MSDTNSVDILREYLTRKNETELRQALVKMEGGLARWVVSSISTRCNWGDSTCAGERVTHCVYRYVKLPNFRLNGRKSVLIERVTHAFLGLPVGRQNEVSVQPLNGIWFQNQKSHTLCSTHPFLSRFHDFKSKVIILQRFHSK